ncbi:exodeoxyribonuclease VII large subunit [Clostridium sp. HMP27]|uniref:exodeoxyribonuclease VII large subunit n=1 Tax=Clostridium sp. HMP27 TaxID=1487921 RepID=UPI00052D51A1|nr:exodeoxyribonuclease VII large subunit [Clostridium sp. HMP27]KGK89046.1 exodeoxyribonuclease VII large subunit [Clostridium sp. HMP27]
MYLKTLTVSDINNYIKKVVDNDFILNNAAISGEISNFKLHSSGHMYFSLKDEYSKINCVMFKGSTRTLKFVPDNGIKVIVKGRISVYEKDGSYQLYCNSIEPEGLGELYIAFEKLKKKLELEGLFNVEHKKPIPKFAEKIGVITSPTGAAIRDIINVSKRRNNNCQIIIYPSLVQGLGASEDVIRGINTFNKMGDLDTIIIARGGGSIEELWAFNDENLARAIYNSKIPIITGVGHEVDYTIADFVSDRRAPTPSAAAEIAVFNKEEILNSVANYKSTLNYRMMQLLKDRYNNIENLKRNLEMNSPERIIVNEYHKLDKIKEALNYNIKTNLDLKKQKLSKSSALLSAHNPLNILSKGFAVIESMDGSIASSLNKLQSLQEVNITLKDGKGQFKIEKA